MRTGATPSMRHCATEHGEGAKRSTIMRREAEVEPQLPVWVTQEQPTPETERMFEASFNATLDRYRHLLSQVGTGLPDLPNDNFDTGEITGPGKYRLNDETHAKWLHALAKQNFIGASPEVRAELVEFFGHPDAPYATKQKPKDWAKVQAELEQLKKAALPEVTGEADGLTSSVHFSNNFRPSNLFF